MTAAEEVLYFICTKGDSARGLTARTWMGRIPSAFWISGQSFAVSQQCLAGRHGEVSVSPCETWDSFSRDLKELFLTALVGPGHLLSGEFLSMASDCPVHDTNSPKQQSHLCFPAWEASCSTLCGLSLSLVFQEAFRPIKSLMIAPSSLHSGFTSAFVADKMCLCINCLKHS